MKRNLAAVTLLVTGSFVLPSAWAQEPQVISPNAYKIPYLGVDGALILGGDDTSREDPRNPGRVVFDKMEYFSFYADVEGQEALAEECQYVYRGAAGDSFFYPERSLGSIWDLFELRNDDEACQAFKYVILRSPHGDPVHMHMRYGDEDSSFADLLDISLLEEDPESFEPWWSLYCSADTDIEDCYE